MRGLNLQYMIRKTRDTEVCLYKFKSWKLVKLKRIFLTFYMQVSTN